MERQQQPALRTRGAAEGGGERSDLGDPGEEDERRTRRPSSARISPVEITEQIGDEFRGGAPGLHPP